MPDYSLTAQLINGVIRLAKLALDVFIMTIFVVQFKFFVDLKKHKLANQM
jgi:hypothetical protein